ncbi:FIG domain-containing protein [Streptomyces xylophagus]|uniref:hypothetical protein n=1 Tax=Streptomyces xylophagus TaxID=285514 RepID=UPI00131C67E8|nr:hypothetical protein [Streptomyces xylophagus]
MAKSTGARVNEYRNIAIDVVANGINKARSELRTQLLSGDVNPHASSAIAGQRGYPPTKIDVVMNDYLGNLVRARVPEVQYFSEESSTNDFPTQGRLYARCDPLDGTTNAFTALGAYAVVLYFEEYKNDKYNHLAGAIASSDGTIVSWEHFGGSIGEVWIDWPSDFNWPSLEGRDEYLNNSAGSGDDPGFGKQVGKPNGTPLHGAKLRRVAVVASTVKRWRDVISRFNLTSEPDSNAPKEEQRWLSTLGGNPFVTPLLLGELGVIIEPHKIKLHDAAYLIPLTLAGGTVVDFHDIDIPVVTTAFSDPSNERGVGPFIASTNEDGIKEIFKVKPPPPS